MKPAEMTLKVKLYNNTDTGGLISLAQGFIQYLKFYLGYDKQMYVIIKFRLKSDYLPASVIMWLCKWYECKYVEAVYCLNVWS